MALTRLGWGRRKSTSFQAVREAPRVIRNASRSNK